MQLKNKPILVPRVRGICSWHGHQVILTPSGLSPRDERLRSSDSDESSDSEEVIRSFDSENLRFDELERGVFVC